FHPYPPARRAGAGFRRHGDHRGAGSGEVRVPAGGVRLRGSAARRYRLRLGPYRGSAGRGLLDPRRHRLPEVRWWLRPADRCAGPDHRGPAQGGRGGCHARGRQAGRRPGPFRPGRAGWQGPRGGMSTATAPSFRTVATREDLPEPWRSFPFLAAELPRYSQAVVGGGRRALVLTVPARAGRAAALVGVGGPVPLSDVRASACTADGAPLPGPGLEEAPPAVASRTRGAWDLLPAPVQHRLVLPRVAHWDWMVTTQAPPRQPGEEREIGRASCRESGCIPRAGG